MRILFVALEPPYPPNYGGRIRTYNILKQVARSNQVTLVTFADPIEQADSIAALRHVCADVVTVRPPVPPERRLVHKLRDVLARYPISLTQFYSVEMEEKLRAVTQSGSFDVAHVDFIQMAQYAHALHPLPQVLTHHNVEGLLLQRQFQFVKQASSVQALTARIENRRWIRYEIDASRRADVLVTVSEEEAEYFRSKVAGKPTFVVPNGVDTNYFQANGYEEMSSALVFTGKMNYLPNIDAMTWFCREILPIVRRQKTDVEFFIVGKDPSSEVLSLGDIEGVTVTGSVEDVRPYLHRAAMCVVPLRFGGGTRLKILEAMSMGIPVITTNVGCEGLELNLGQDLIVADSPQDFAAQVLNLFDDPSLRKSLTVHGRRAVEQRYDWTIIADEQEKAYRVAREQQAQANKRVPVLVS